MLSKYLAIQDGLSDFVGRAIRWLPILMIGVLLYEIFSRSLFGTPTEWAHESSTMLYGSFCILAGVYTMRHRGHVRSDVIYRCFGQRSKAFCDILGQSISLVCLFIFFKLSLTFAIESWEVLELSTKSTWQPPVYPFKSVVPLAVGLLILQLLAELVRSVFLFIGIDIDDPRER